jgi:hypothetical protein
MIQVRKSVSFMIIMGYHVSSTINWAMMYCLPYLMFTVLAHFLTFTKININIYTPPPKVEVGRTVNSTSLNQ